MLETNAEPELASTEVVRLIAKREVTTRLRSRFFRVVTIVTALIVVGFIIVGKLLSGATSTQVVGYPPGEQGVAAAVAASAQTSGVHVTLQQVATASAGQAAVSGGDMDAFFTVSGTTISVIVQQSLAGGVGRARC